MSQRCLHWLTFSSFLALKYGHLLVFGQGNVDRSNTHSSQAFKLPGPSSARFPMLSLCIWRRWGKEKEFRSSNQAWKRVSESSKPGYHDYTSKKIPLRWVGLLFLSPPPTVSGGTERRLGAYEVEHNLARTVLCLGMALALLQLHLP